MSRNNTMTQKKKHLMKLFTELEVKYTNLIKPTANILKGISKRSHEYAGKSDLATKEKFSDLYNLLTMESLLIQAYGNIKSNKGSLTPGVSTETIDGMSLRKIKKLANDIKEGKFRFSRVRRVWIQKQKRYKKGEKIKLRPLGIPNFSERIVQEAIRIILEAIYEPIFENKDANYGFRPKKGTHHVIKKIKDIGSNCTVAIEGDIEGAYDNVDHDIMKSILRKRINDEKFIKLLDTGFKSGILDQGNKFDTLTGVPQGGLASPVLFNIYMHQFDEYIENELQQEVDKINANEDRSQKPRNSEYDSTQVRLDRLRKKYKQWKGDRKHIDLTPEEKLESQDYQKRLKKLSMVRAKLPSLRTDKRLIKIIYIRYADDWIIITNGKRQVAERLKEKINIWLKENLKLNLSPTKTKITNLKIQPVLFIGFSIKTYNKRRFTLNKYGEMTKRAGWDLIIDVDMQRVVDRLIIKKFCNTKYKPISKRPWTVLNPEEIIKRYNYMIRGLADFYFPVLDRLTTINFILYILKFSCLSTFAQKYKTKITKITAKYGDPLKIKVLEIQKFKNKKGEVNKREVEKEYAILTYQDMKKALDYKKYNWNAKTMKLKVPGENVFMPMADINWRSLRNLDSICAVCGTTENVEMHHIKHIRKGKITGFAQVMKQINRKTIPLCATHHREVHQGKYDDIKLSDLYGIERFLL
jgi:retron-type reverse transcriptase